MRNTWKYPITAEELIRYLNSLLEEENKRFERMMPDVPCGCMTSLYLEALIKLVAENKDKVEGK